MIEHAFNVLVNVAAIYAGRRAAQTAMFASGVARTI